MTLDVTFDEDQITLFGSAVPYDPYYFAIEAGPSECEYHALIRDMFAQWAAALESYSSASSALILPFGIYDQCVECFAVETDRDQIALRRVWVNVEGWTLDLRELRPFMVAHLELLNPSEEIFGSYDKQALIIALMNARRAT